MDLPIYNSLQELFTNSRFGAFSFGLELVNFTHILQGYFKDTSLPLCL